MQSVVNSTIYDFNLFGYFVSFIHEVILIFFQSYPIVRYLRMFLLPNKLAHAASESIIRRGVEVCHNRQLCTWSKYQSESSVFAASSMSRSLKHEQRENQQINAQILSTFYGPVYTFKKIKKFQVHSINKEHFRTNMEYHFKRDRTHFCFSHENKKLFSTELA